jgi:hypothetical protein
MMALIQNNPQSQRLGDMGGHTCIHMWEERLHAYFEKAFNATSLDGNARGQFLATRVCLLG